MGAGAVLGIAGMGGFLFFRKRKQAQEKQAQNHNQDHKEGQA
jgi:hypothetical protein